MARHGGAAGSRNGHNVSYVEVGSVKGSAESYLRMFCKNGVKEPLFIFITDQVILKEAPHPEGPVAFSEDYVMRILRSLNFVLAAGSNQWTGQFQIQDVQGFAQKDDAVRVYAAVRRGDTILRCSFANSIGDQVSEALLNFDSSSR